MSDEQAGRLDDHVDGRHDFDFFLGEWRVANRKLADPLAEGPDSRTWLEFEATAKAEPILVGLGNYNTYSAPGFPGTRAFTVSRCVCSIPRLGFGGSSRPLRSGVASLIHQWSVSHQSLHVARGDSLDQPRTGRRKG